MSRPLAQVLSRPWGDFEPEHPERAPWYRERLARVERAHTGNVAVVNLAAADRAYLRGVAQPSWHQDWLELFDWTPAGWGVDGVQ